MNCFNIIHFFHSKFVIFLLVFIKVLVINHESTSSSDCSTVGSIGSDNKTYLRGQNIPVDTNILQEREVKRQKALELQNAIKKQLEEKDRQKKEEKEQRLREERLEEERIKREREKEKERYKRIEFIFFYNKL